MSENTQAIILAAIADIKDDMREGLSGVHQRLDTLNGRTRKVETSTSIQWFLWVMVGASLLALLSNSNFIGVITNGAS